MENKPTNESLERKDRKHEFSINSLNHRLRYDTYTFAYDLDYSFGKIDHTLIGNIGDLFEQLQMQTVLFIIENQLFVESNCRAKLLLQI